MSKNSLISLSILAAASSFGLAAETWTDNTLKHQVVAEFVALKNDELVLKKEDGSVIRVPLNRLSVQSKWLAKQLDPASLKYLEFRPTAERIAMLTGVDASNIISSLVADDDVQPNSRSVHFFAKRVETAMNSTSLNGLDEAGDINVGSAAIAMALNKGLFKQGRLSLDENKAHIWCRVYLSSFVDPRLKETADTEHTNMSDVANAMANAAFGSAMEIARLESGVVVNVFSDATVDDSHVQRAANYIIEQLRTNIAPHVTKYAKGNNTKVDLPTRIQVAGIVVNQVAALAAHYGRDMSDEGNNMAFDYLLHSIGDIATLASACKMDIGYEDAFAMSAQVMNFGFVIGEIRSKSFAVDVLDESFDLFSRVVRRLPDIEGYKQVSPRKDFAKAWKVLETVIVCAAQNGTDIVDADIDEALSYFGSSESGQGTEESTSITNEIGMQFKLIPSGEFLMGSPDDDPDKNDDETPRHRVRITKPFYMGAHEVTQEQYLKVMGKNPSSLAGARHPVERVSWENAAEFCSKLSDMDADYNYRLPTEAEWEYACRAGTTTQFSCGDKLDPARAWFDDNSANQTHSVGKKLPNAFGLYDMHGNVWEWCSDWYDGDYYGSSPPADPTGPSTGSSRAPRRQLEYPG